MGLVMIELGFTSLVHLLPFCPMHNNLAILNCINSLNMSFASEFMQMYFPLPGKFSLAYYLEKFYRIPASFLK